MSMRSASATSRQCSTGPHSQRGAIGLWGSLTLLLAVLFMALAVDTGRLWMQQRKLQSIADIASMEAARKIGCNTDLDTVRAAAQTAAARNGYSGQLSQAPNLVELGSVNTVSGIRQFTDDSDQEAVRVYATQSVAASLVAGGLFGNQVLLNAEAVSAADPTLVAFTAGTFLLNVNTESAALMNALLGDLLGVSLNLSALSYEGLIAANLTLGDLLQADGSVSNINQLLENQTTLGNLVDLIAAGVASAGTASSAATAALQQLGVGPGDNTPIKLSDILTVSSPNEDGAADLNLNAFSLITAAALFANEQSTVNLSLAGINADITITQAPMLAVGPSQGNNCTVARTAQLALGVSAAIAVPLVGSVSVFLNTTIAPGMAELIQFSDNGSSSNVVIAATPGIATITGNATLTILGNPVAVGINLPLASATAQNVVFNVAHPTVDNLPATEGVGSSLGDSLENALQQDDILTIPALGPVLELAIGALLEDVIAETLSPLLGQIGRVLLDPLLEMLGIRLGGMHVTVHDIQLRQSRPLVI